MNDQTINVEVDATDALNEIKELQDKETLKRDKFILDMTINAYQQAEKRGSDIDNKINSMIAVIGIMLSIQSSLYVFLISQLTKLNTLNNNILLIGLMLISLGYYILSIKTFIEAYYFKKYTVIPNTDYLIRSAKENVHEHNITADLLASFGKATKDNNNIITDKVVVAKKGFNYFKWGGYTTVLFVSEVNVS